MQIISETVWEASVHRIVSRTKHHPAELGVLLPAGAHHTELAYRVRGGFGGLPRIFSGASPARETTLADRVWSGGDCAIRYQMMTCDDLASPTASAI